MKSNTKTNLYRKEIELIVRNNFGSSIVLEDREALPKFMNAEPEDIGIIAPYKDV